MNISVRQCPAHRSGYVRSSPLPLMRNGPSGSSTITGVWQVSGEMSISTYSAAHDRNGRITSTGPYGPTRLLPTPAGLRPRHITERPRPATPRHRFDTQYIPLNHVINKWRCLACPESRIQMTTRIISHRFAPGQDATPVCDTHTSISAAS